MSEKSPQEENKDNNGLSESDLVKGLLFAVIVDEAREDLDSHELMHKLNLDEPMDDLEFDELMDDLDLDEVMNLQQKVDDQEIENAHEEHILTKFHPVTIGGTILLVAFSAARFIMSDPQPEAYIAVIAFVALLLALYSILS